MRENNSDKANDQAQDVDHHPGLERLVGMIITVLIFPKFEVTSIGQGPEAGVRLFAMAFGFGFGWHAIVSEVGKWSGVFRGTQRKE